MVSQPIFAFVIVQNTTGRRILNPLTADLESRHDAGHEYNERELHNKHALEPPAVFWLLIDSHGQRLFRAIDDTEKSVTLKLFEKKWFL